MTINKKIIFSNKRTDAVFNKETRATLLKKVLQNDTDFAKEFYTMSSRNEKERLAKLDLERERENSYQRLNDLYTGN